jgi:hypothetical protein
MGDFFFGHKNRLDLHHGIEHDDIPLEYRVPYFQTKPNVQHQKPEIDGSLVFHLICRGDKGPMSLVCQVDFIGKVPSR